MDGTWTIMKSWTIELDDETTAIMVLNKTDTLTIEIRTSIMIGLITVVMEDTTIEITRRGHRILIGLLVLLLFLAHVEYRYVVSKQGMIFSRFQWM